MRLLRTWLSEEVNSKIPADEIEVEKIFNILDCFYGMDELNGSRRSCETILRRVMDYVLKPTINRLKFAVLFWTSMSPINQIIP